MAPVAKKNWISNTCDPMTPNLLRVIGAWRENSDTFTLEIDRGVTPWLPGQFNMVGVAGLGEVPLSISGDPADTRAITHTIREVGNITRALARLRPGSLATVRGPFGSAWPLSRSEGLDVVLIAGGVGLVPLVPALCHVIAKPHMYGRVTLLYGARTPEDVLFKDLLEEWASRSNVHVGLTVDHPEPSWRFDVGVVTRLIHRARLRPTGSIAMVCGPEVMMRFTIRELLSEGFRAEDIWLSLERNMKCGVGLCGHCQIRGEFVCGSGPVYPYAKIAPLLEVPEL